MSFQSEKETGVITGGLRFFQSRGCFNVFIALLFFVFAPRAGAAELTALPGVTGEPGSEVVIPIRIDDASGVLSLSLHIGYGDAVLEYLGVEKGELTTGWGNLVAHMSSPGSIFASGLNNTALAGSGALVNVRFRIRNTVNPGDYSAIRLISAKLNDGQIPVTTRDGVVHVDNVAQFSIPQNLEASRGDSVVVPISVDDATGAQTVSLDLTYDASSLTYMETTAGALVQGWGLFQAHAHDGVVSIGTLDQVSLIGGGVVAVVIFQVAASAQVNSLVPITLAAPSLNDGQIPAAGVTATVRITNTDPVISQGTSVSVTMSEDGSPTLFSLTLNATDAEDADNALLWSVSSPATHGTASVSGPGASKAIAYMPISNYYGSDAFVVKVTDSNLGTDTITVNVTIDSVNDAPLLDFIGNKQVDEGATLTFILSASDLEGHGLAFSVTNAPAGSSFDPGTATFTWTPDFGTKGNYRNIEFRVVDDGTPPESDTEAITISVGDVNRPPVLDLIGNQEISEGATLSIQLTASDPDTNNLEYSVLNAPSGSNFETSTGIFSWTPDYGAVGVYPNIVFTVTDDGVPPEMDSESITITVLDVNRPPVLAPIGNQEINEGHELSFTVSASDPDNDNLTYSATNLPLGASLDQVTGVFSWTPDYGAVGTYANIQFVVTDDGVPFPESDSEIITITVVGVEPIIVYVDLANSTGIENGSQANPFTSIRVALDVVQPGRGDRVVVYPGEYVENIIIPEGTMLTTTDSAYHTFIVGLDADPLVLLGNGAALHGFTIMSATVGVEVSAGASTKLVNCVLYANGTGALVNEGASLDTTNCTFVANTTGLQAHPAATAALRNNIFTNNGTAISAPPAKSATSEYNCFFNNDADYAGSSAGVNDFVDDPLFIDLANLNFHLMWDSPCREAGDPSNIYFDKDGSRNDIGADGGPLGVRDTLAPSGVIATDPSPAEGIAPFTVVFDASASFDEWGIAFYSWDFDSQAVLDNDAQGAVVEHTYTAAGTYIVTLTVTDHSGIESHVATNVTVSEEGNLAPSAAFTMSPIGGALPLFVQFSSAGSSDSDGEIVSFDWSFGDGGESTLANPSHTFLGGLPPGSYTVSLTVTDNDGATATVLHAVTLTASPPIVDPTLVSPDETTEFTIPREASAVLGGATFTFPQGAVSTPIAITVSEPTPDKLPPAQEGSVSFLYIEFGPAGTVFNIPITVTIPFPTQPTLPGGVEILYYVPNTDSWTDDGITNLAWANGVLSFQMAHFSIIAAHSTKGDTNFDTAINALDIQLVINSALGLNAAPAVGGWIPTDVNQDKIVNALDIQMVINAALGLNI